MSEPPPGPHPDATPIPEDADGNSPGNAPAGADRSPTAAAAANGERPPGVAAAATGTDAAPGHAANIAEPASPARRRHPVRALVDDLVASFNAANPTALAAEVAYSVVFALPSLVLLIVTLAVLADARTGSAITGSIEAGIERQAPAELRPILFGLVASASARAAETAPTVGAAVSSLVALWVAGGGFAALAGACARAGGRTDARPFLKRRLLAVGSVLLLAALLVLSFLVFVFGEAIGHELGRRAAGAETFDAVWAALRDPLGLVLVVAGLLFIYRVGAGVRAGWRWLLPGAALAAVLWYGLVRGFGLYLRLLDPGSAYGPAGSLVALLFFVYASSLVFIGGAMLSAVLGRRYDSA